MTTTPTATDRDMTPLADNPALRPDDLPPELARALPGKFVVFEGPDGSGKSTQLARFVRACQHAGVPPVEVREPGGTEVGERIRRALLDHLDREEMALRCEMLLYMASRAQLVEQTIRPALARNQFVLADRFVSSTLAYQGAGGGLPEDQILDAARIATGNLEPHAVVIFDVDERTAAQRLNPLLRGDNLDRMESKGAEFQRRVRQGYLDQIARWPDTHLCVDGSQDEDAVFSDLIATLVGALA
ncbi:MAG: dTMP kinase [Phycisphaerales bacterium]